MHLQRLSPVRDGTDSRPDTKPLPEKLRFGVAQCFSSAITGSRTIRASAPVRPESSFSANGKALSISAHSRRSKGPRFHVRVVFLLFMFFAAALPAAGKSWRVADFDDVITIGGDGSSQIRERITLVFIADWHGIHRFIPVEYPGPRGTNYTLFLKVRSVTDADGGKLKY